jgi:flagellar L-ring protein precursor FlgH
MNRSPARSIASPLAMTAVVALPFALAGPSARAQESLMAQNVAASQPLAKSGVGHALRDASMFAIAPPELRVFKEHDLVEIVVRESSSAERSHELEAGKDYRLDGSIGAWPAFQLPDLLELQLRGSDTDNLPRLNVDFKKDFDGEGDYSREDDFTARLTAEVIEVLPNGNLVLEARTTIKTDEEESTIKVTGVCRQDDVSAANQVFSSNLHDLRVEKLNQGELKKANEKGIIAKILDTIFAF